MPRADRTETDAARRSLIAARLREARRLAGLSQGQVARLMDVHRPTISEIEAGNRRVSAEELQRLAELYDVSPAWILGKNAETDDVHDARVQLAARELGKLKPDDLGRLLSLLASMRASGGSHHSTGGTDSDGEEQ